MRLGIDCRTIGGGSELVGVGQYTLFLVRELLRQDCGQDCGNEYVLFFKWSIADQKIRMLIGEYPKVKIVKLSAGNIPFVSAHISAARAIARERLDLLHVPDGHLPYFYRGPAVITVHDLAILKHPEWFPESMLERFISTQVLLRRAIARARRIIVPSESTAKDLKHFYSPTSERNPELAPRLPSEVRMREKVNCFTFEGMRTGSAMSRRDRDTLGEQRAERSYGVRSDRMRVIPLAPALPQKSRAPANIPSGHYLLFIGTLEPRKNLLRLLRAFQKIDDQDVWLVLAGKHGWKDREIMETIKKTKRIEYLGYVSEEEKRWLIEHALAFVFPSLYEGFGLPVLEAMSVGIPVITSHTSSLPEVAGNAALLIDPEDEDVLRDALNHIITDETQRAELSARGRVLAATFSWTKTAVQTLAVYQELMYR